MTRRLGSEKNEVFYRIVQVVNRMLQASQQDGLRKLPEIKDETDIIGELGIDSVEMMDLIGLLEKEFSISIDLEHAARKKTVGEIADYLEKLLQET